MQPGHLEPQGLARARIEVGQRFVQQQDPGLDGERAGQREAPALLERQVVGLAAGDIGQTEPPQHGLDALGHVVATDTAQVESEGHVGASIQMRPQRALMEHVPDPASSGGQMRDVLGVDDHAATAEWQKSGDGPEDRRLA